MDTLRSLLNVMPESSFVVDEHGIVVAANRASELEFGEIVGLPLRSLTTLDPVAMNVLLERALRGSDPIPGFLPLSNSERRACRLSRITVSLGGAVGVVIRLDEMRTSSVFRELTETVNRLGREVREWKEVSQERALLLREREQLADRLTRTIAELQSASAAKDEFLGLVSHELKNPLTSVLGLSRHAATTLDTAERDEIRETLEVVVAAASRISEIIENMLALSRSEQGLDALEPVNLRRLLEDLVKREAIARPLRVVRLLTTTDLPPVLGHYGWIELVVLNLLSNAEKYSRANTCTDVTADASEGWVTVSVIDEGEGLPNGTGNEVFDAFVRLSSNPSVPGLGLGLAVVQRFIGAMGGHIELGPRRDGRPGTEARFRLPVAQELI